MENVNFEKWIKEVKNYYKLVRFIGENNYDSVPNVTYKFCDLLSEFNEMVLLYGKSICYIVYVELYVKGKSMAKLAKDLGVSRTYIYKLHKKLLKWFEEIYNYLIAEEI